MIERRSVPENKHYVAVKAADLDQLETERDRLRELLRDINTYGIDGLHVGHPLRNRIDAALKEGS